jgi:hypothetical protein
MRKPLLLLAILASSCDQGFSLEEFDAGNDFSIRPQATLVGPGTITCCMTTRGANFALYLAKTQPGDFDQQGHEIPPLGELHVTNPYGADYVLSADVPAFGYGFSPDGRFAMFMTKSKENYALKFATLGEPDFKKPLVHTVVEDGLQDYQLFQIGFFSPSGRYFVLGVTPAKVMRSMDLHLIDMRTGVDVMTLDKGAFAYLELFSPDDTMVFENSTASTVVGVPSVQGLYFGNLQQMIAGARPQPIDTHTGAASLMSDGFTLIYVKTNGDLMLFDLKEKYHVKLASGAVSFSLGAGRRGPIVWIGADGSLHVAPKLGPEILTLPAGTADLFSPLQFTPDNQRLYYYQRVSTQNANGELYTVRITPGVAATPTFIGARASTQDFMYVQERLMYVGNVDNRGETGDLISSFHDGSDPYVISRGVGLGGMDVSFPRPIPPMEEPSAVFLPRDLGAEVIPPVFANLTGAVMDVEKYRTAFNDSRPLVGALSFGTSVRGPQGIVDPAVHAGVFRFSDDGYVLAYAGGATWNDDVANYVGKLNLMPTKIDIGILPITLDGVSEMGPIRDRALFVNAPAAAKPGIYFIKY